MQNINFDLVVTDTNSLKEDVDKIKEILNQSDIKNNFISINIDKFKDKIKPGYSKAKFSNMANFYTSLQIVKDCDVDIIYFVEDDYLHSENCITEMIYAYEKFNTIFSKDLILLPSDYPYLYSKDENTKLYLGEKNHWRLVTESLVTFMTSKKLIENNYNNLEKMGIEWLIHGKSLCTKFINPTLAYLQFLLLLFIVQI